MQFYYHTCSHITHNDREGGRESCYSDSIHEVCWLYRLMSPLRAGTPEQPLVSFRVDPTLPKTSPGGRVLDLLYLQTHMELV